MTIKLWSMILLAQFTLFFHAGSARGDQVRLIAQIDIPGLQEILDEDTSDTGQEPLQEFDDLALPESPEPPESPESPEDFELPPEEDKQPVSAQDTERPTADEDTTEQAPDTCSQMLQFPFLERVIDLAGFSVDIPSDFSTLSREAAFNVMKEILVRRGFSSFAQWDDRQAVKQKWYLDFVYGLLERDGLVEPEASAEKRKESLDLGGYLSRIWSQENCACYEDILNSFKDLIITEILGRDRPQGSNRPFPFYQGVERELLESDLINIITTASGLGRRMYMSRQGISEENFCHVQRELLLRNGYTEFAPIDCVSYVSKNWYADFLSFVLSDKLNLRGVHNATEKEEALVKQGYLPPSALYRQNIYEEDIYQVINDPDFLAGLNRRDAQETDSEDEAIPQLPDVYEEPISPVR